MRISARQLLEGGPTVSVGMLTADLLKLGDELSLLDGTGATLVHVDVMDGVFCPQFTVGPPIVKAIPDRFVKDCHLMIADPLERVEEFVAAGAGIVTFHVEATPHPHRVLQSLAGAEVIRGVALNPGTPLQVLEPLIDDLELILLLSINPGWSGQKFIARTADRLRAARELIDGRDVVLGVDGGITKTNIEQVAEFRPDLVVSGSAIFDGVAPAENARFMLGVVRGQHAAATA